MSITRKQFASFYTAKVVPKIIELPEITYLSSTGQGDPSTSTEYKRAVETLYALHYALKKARGDFLGWKPPHLETFWGLDGQHESITSLDRSEWRWKVAIPQFRTTTDELFARAKEIALRKNQSLLTEEVNLESIQEGLCAQVIHLGPYVGEDSTILSVEKFAEEKGYHVDTNGARLHHEIYVKGPIGVQQDKWKTIIRLPIIG